MGLPGEKIMNWLGGIFGIGFLTLCIAVFTAVIMAYVIMYYNQQKTESYKRRERFQQDDEKNRHKRVYR
jgi:uncharacterized membrane protein